MLLEPVRQSPYPGMLHLAYRPDVDGLRALAVLAVLAFHAFPERFESGFIGVDIFFVISGYLISAIIFQDIDQGRFSIRRFYSRRIRRIFPALLLVLLFVLTIGYPLLLPEDYRALGKHVLGGATFSSNIILWMEAGYFDAASLYKPLVHLWSLGIEEQFYIFFPMLLFCCSKIKFDALKIIFIVFLISFADNIYLSGKDFSAVFYFPLARIWELLAGALLSALFRKPQAGEIWLRYDRVLARWGRQTVYDGHSLSCVLALGGVVCLGLSFAVVQEAGHPGWAGLLPVTGTVLLIAAGPANPFSKYILSNRLAVCIGLISYPLYLWHWPLLSYAAILVGTGSDTDVLRVALCCLSFVLATMTYLWVERPVRFHLKQAKIVIPCLCCLVMFLGCAGAWVYMKKGFPDRLAGVREPEPSMIALQHKVRAGYTTFLETYSRLFDKNDNLSGLMSRMSAPIEDIEIAIIGDSYADQLFPGLLDVLGDKKSLAVFAAACAVPYQGLANFNPKYPSRTFSAKMIRIGYDIITHNDNIKTVLIVHHADCSYKDLIDIQHPDGEKDTKIILERGMRRTFDELTAANKNIFVVLENPELPFNPKYCTQEIFSFSNQCIFKRDSFDHNREVNWYKTTLLKVIKDYPHIKIIDLSDYLCDRKCCYAKHDGTVLYHDTRHLSFEGSLFVAPEIAKALE